GGHCGMGKGAGRKRMGVGAWQIRGGTRRFPLPRACGAEEFVSELVAAEVTATNRQDCPRLPVDITSPDRFNPGLNLSAVRERIRRLLGRHGRGRRSTLSCRAS